MRVHRPRILALHANRDLLAWGAHAWHDIACAEHRADDVFRGFGGTCETRNNGDAVVRYDQLADRWLIVMPIFGRAPARDDQPPVWTARDAAYVSPAGRADQPGPAVALFQPAGSLGSARAASGAVEFARTGPSGALR